VKLVARYKCGEKFVAICELLQKAAGCSLTHFRFATVRVHCPTCRHSTQVAIYFNLTEKKRPLLMLVFKLN